MTQQRIANTSGHTGRVLKTILLRVMFLKTLSKARIESLSVSFAMFLRKETYELLKEVSKM